MIFVLLFGMATGAFGDIKNQLVDQLLIQELSQYPDDSFPLPWAYSNEGGVIKYAEMDLVGDGRNEIIYSRSSSSIRGERGAWRYDIYFQPTGEERFVQIASEVYLGDFRGFHKKEEGKSLFLDATEGRNFAIGSEPAFTKKLVIKEVSPRGVKTETHLIDHESDPDVVKMWEAALFEHDEASASVMEGLGFSVKNPNFKWISLKDYLLGKEWKDDNDNDWSALGEFETEGVIWRVPKDSVTPSFLDFARQVRELRNQVDFWIPSEAIEFPDGYLSPKEAYRLILEKTGHYSGSDAVDEKGAESRGPSRRAVKEKRSTSIGQIEHEQTEDSQSNGSAGLAWIFAGVLLILLVLLFRAFMRGRAS